MKPEIRIFEDLTSLSQAAAELFAQTAESAIEARGRFLAALSGGNTPLETYRLLVQQPVDWRHVHVFWGDERCVSLDDPENNAKQAMDALLNHVSIPTDNIYRIECDFSIRAGQRLGPAAAALDYAIVLKRFAEPPFYWPRFDLVLAGMGDDGHTAALFPGSPVDVSDAVIPVTAQYQNRAANRVTLTPPVFNSARRVVFLVSGQSKSETLASVLNGGYRPEELPAQRIQPMDGELMWFVDKAAASSL